MLVTIVSYVVFFGVLFGFGFVGFLIGRKRSDNIQAELAKINENFKCLRNRLVDVEESIDDRISGLGHVLEERIDTLEASITEHDK